MKKVFLLLSWLSLFHITLTVQANIIDSIKIIPQNPTISESVWVTAFSSPFAGDCSYRLNVDSIIDTKIYISGKFEGNLKCMGRGANDTISMGVLQAGEYELTYSFIDISGSPIPTEIYTLEFVVLGMIDSIKIIPQNPTTSGTVSFAAFSSPFIGDCSYQLNVDSIIDTTIYISGKIESDVNCYGEGANDTINLGLIPAGTYNLIYKFIDIYSPPRIQTETYTLEFVVTISTNVQEIKKQETATLYPNPCTSYINISFSSKSNENKHIQLFDALGKMIYEKESNQNPLQIDMSVYNQGIYYVKLPDNDAINVYKIIKE